MAYEIIKSNGTLLLSLGDGLTDSVSSSITFVGKNVSQFGEIQNTNFLHLLENFASENEPAHKLNGQLWFDNSTSTRTLKVYNSDRWQQLAVLAYGPSSTSANQTSNLWYDTDNDQLFINTGTAFTLIGPEKAPGFNPTRFVSETILDTADTPHPIIKCLVNDEVIYTISGDTFVTSSTNLIPGILTVYRGMTLKDGGSLSTSTSVIGTSKFAISATTLRSQDGTAYLSASTATTADTIVQRTNTGGINATTVNATALTGAGTIDGAWTVNVGLKPDTNGGAYLGTNSLRWSDVYVQTADVTTLNASVSKFSSQLTDTNLYSINRFDNDSALTADSPFRLPTQYAVKHYVDNKIANIDLEFEDLDPASIPSVSNTLVKRDSNSSIFANTATLTALKLSASTPIVNNIDPDGAMTANSDSRLATQRAIKKYIDDMVSQEVTNRINGDTNLQTQIDTLRAIPAGAVFYVAGSTVPTGYLAANGQAVAKASYPALYTALGGASSPYGQSSTTFNLPDLRGEFIRGWDNSRGIDTGRNIGTWQKGSLIGFDESNDAVWSLATTEDGETSPSGLGMDRYNDPDYPVARLRRAVYDDAVIDLSTNGGSRGWVGISRPRNVAMLAIIKF